MVCDKLPKGVFMSLSNLQIELLKTFQYELSESQLTEIKQVLSAYFADKVTFEMDKFCKENGWDDEIIDTLSTKHLRAKYE